MGDAIEKIKRGVSLLLFSYAPPEPVTSRWLTCLNCAGWFLRAILVHNLLPRAYASAFGSMGEAINIAQELLDGPPDNDDDPQPDDDYVKATGKRLRKGKKTSQRAIVWLSAVFQHNPDISAPPHYGGVGPTI